MDRSSLVEKVAVALQDCTTAQNVKISHTFTNDEMYDFANTIVTYLPDNLDTRVDKVIENVITLLPAKKEFVLAVLKQYTRDITLGIINNDDISKELHHVVILSLIVLSQQYNLNVDDAIDDTINYYESLVLSGDQLIKNIQIIVVEGATTMSNKDYTSFIRIEEERYKFIPTLTTKKNFKYLIT